jgi:transcriptional antiterminator NusG
VNVTGNSEAFSKNAKTKRNAANMNTQLKWYAVYTRPCWERKVSQLLTIKQIENYCPLQKTYRQWSDRKKIIYDPLFKSYVFIHTSPKETMPVLQTDGVLNIVSCLGKPAVIRDEEIELIRQFLNEYKNIQVHKLDLHKNDLVKINGGPLITHTGTVLAVKSKTVKVLLPSLGFAMTAEVEINNIEKLHPASY